MPQSSDRIRICRLRRPEVITPFRIQQAAWTAAAGGVIAYPTEAVWGLGCDPLDQRAVYRILDLKNRHVRQGLILVAADQSQIDWLLEGLEPAMLERLSASWPGPISWLIPHHGRVPEWICGAHCTVAVRVSAHPVVKRLCQAFGGPLVSTSANPGGKAAARERHQVVRYFGEQLDYIAPGHTGGGLRPSAIMDLASGAQLRT